jgi:hypothetical protein
MTLEEFHQKYDAIMSDYFAEDISEDVMENLVENLRNDYWSEE